MGFKDVKDKAVVWYLKKKLKGSPMLKYLRKYSILSGVGIVCAATALRYFGQEGWADMLSGLAQGVGLTLEGSNAPVSIAEVSGAVLGLLGVGTKLLKDHQKRKAAKANGPEA